MTDQHKNPSRTILLWTIAVAVIAMLLVVPFTIEGDAPRSPQVSHDDDVETRIQPVARFELQTAPAPAAADAGKPRDGATIYNSICGVCHNAGVAGAPKPEDKGNWAPRLALGKEALYKSAIGGKNAMPARGGAADLTDAEVKAAVDHLLKLVK